MLSSGSEKIGTSETCSDVAALVYEIDAIMFTMSFQYTMRLEFSMIIKSNSLMRVSACQRTPFFVYAKTGGSFCIEVKSANKAENTELFQLHIASFFKFIAAYLSLTHRVTAAKPR